MSDGSDKKDLKDGIPREEIVEITNRISVLDLPPPKEMSDSDLGAVLASFEEQLLELNQALRREASGKIVSLRIECEKTEEVVEGLNSALDERLKEHG